MNNIIRYKWVLVAIAALILIGFIAFLLTPKEDIDTLPEGTNLDPSSYVMMKNGEELLQNIGSLDAYERLSKDLHVFGKTAYSDYRSTSSKVIGFKVESKVQKSEQTITTSGRFGSSKNKILLTVTVLKNGRINTSITDTATQFNIDSSLPSRNNIDEFIGTLPIHGEGYDITYSPPQSIGISVYSRDPNLYDRAYSQLQEKLSAEELSGIQLSVTLPTPSFNAFD